MKKPSGTRAERLLDASTFYVDDCLGKCVAESLRADGWKIEWHREHFAKDGVKDTEIYEYIGLKKWVFLTKDKRIKSTLVELDKLIDCELKAISMSGGDMTGVKIAEMFIFHKLHIGRILKKNAPPFIATLNKGGLAISQSVKDRIKAREQRAT